MLSMFKPHKILPSNPDFEKLRPNFGWLPKDVVKATIENSTQWYQGENRYPMRCHIKSRFPAANVNHLPDTVSYDTLFSDTPALDDGIKGHGRMHHDGNFLCQAKSISLWSATQL